MVIFILFRKLRFRKYHTVTIFVTLGKNELFTAGPVEILLLATRGGPVLLYSGQLESVPISTDSQSEPSI